MPVAGWDRVASFHRAATHGAKILPGRQVLSTRLQSDNYPAIIIGEVGELLAALDEVGIPVHKEFIWLHFVDNLSPGYVVKIAGDRAMPIEGIVDVPMSLWSGKDWVQVTFPNIAHVPLLGYNLLPLKRKADHGHTYVGEKKEVISHLKIGKTLFGPSVGKLNYLSGFRRSLDLSRFALATIAPGEILSVSPANSNTFHTRPTGGHVYEKLLRFTAKQLGVVLEGSFRECEGCSVAKDLGKPIDRIIATEGIWSFVRRNLLRKMCCV